MEELYFTIAGCSHYFGSDFMEWRPFQVLCKR